MKHPTTQAAQRMLADHHYCGAYYENEDRQRLRDILVQVEEEAVRAVTVRTRGQTMVLEAVIDDESLN